MALPKYHETFIPILEILNQVDSLNSRELASKVRDEYYSDLPQELLIQKTSSGAEICDSDFFWFSRVRTLIVHSDGKYDYKIS